MRHPGDQQRDGHPGQQRAEQRVGPHRTAALEHEADGSIVVAVTHPVIVPYGAEG